MSDRTNTILECIAAAGVIIIAALSVYHGWGL